MKIYSGVGSRESPPEILIKIKMIAKYLAKNDYILRSGGANGADIAFELGCDEVLGKKEIYLPWKGFNNSDSKLYNISDEALYLAKHYHPNWNNLSQAAKKLMARNCYQVLGLDLITPCNFICCWTVNEEFKGGTSQTLRIAKDKGIPIFNLYHESNQLKHYLIGDKLF